MFWRKSTDYHPNNMNKICICTFPLEHSSSRTCCLELWHILYNVVSIMFNGQGYEKRNIHTPAVHGVFSYVCNIISSVLQVRKISEKSYSISSLPNTVKTIQLNTDVKLGMCYLSHKLKSEVKNRKLYDDSKKKKWFLTDGKAYKYDTCIALARLSLELLRIFNKNQTNLIANKQL